MKRTAFNEPRPKGFEEMIEAFDEKDVSPADCNAEIDHDDEDGDYQGYSAEIRTNEEGDEVFSTLGYEERDDLVKDLLAAGIALSDISDV